MRTLASRGLKVLPSGRPGRGRLYVNLPDGRAVAWYDRRANRISVLADERREEILTALRPYLTGTVAIGPPPVPTAEDLLRLSLPPDEDLAPNRPGEALLGALTYGTAGTRARHRLRQELTVRQRMGDVLDALADSEDWKVLHSVHSLHPVADHLLIGPPGVFCIRTVQGRRQRTVIGELLLTVGRANPTPDPREARRAATYATRALSTPVTPVLAVVDATRLEITPTLRDVQVLTPSTTSTFLTNTPTTLKLPDIEALFTKARDRRTWQ
ncbi:nuclease-related domain-containing protein [Streptomyces sp. NPDC056773]|uniref:nuclease-related domain-containing protein n=1 Tax=unclassified Streptomyces TaxID=2593676 RepID=UPI0036757898